MIFRALSSLGDWSFGNGKSSYAIDEQAIEHNLKTRILSWKNDCFFDYEAGIDWTARLDKLQRAQLISDLKSLIIQTYGVVNIESVTVTDDPLTRGSIMTYTIDTIFSSSFTRAVSLAAGNVVS